MGKPSQTRKERKYLKAGDLVKTVKHLRGSPVGMIMDYNDMFPKLGEIGLVLSVKRMTKRDRRSECVILFGERKLRFAGSYWEAFKKLEQERNPL